MNKKGQALVEFIIILPVFIFMLLAMIDIGKILYFNNKIESKIDDVITMYENKYQYEVIKKSISKDLKLHSHYQLQTMHRQSLST